MEIIKLRDSNDELKNCRHGHKPAEELIRFAYQSIPKLVKAGKPAVFVHPKLHLHTSYDYEFALAESWKAGVSNEDLDHLFRTNITAVSVDEALIALQVLLIYLSKLLFSSAQADADQIVVKKLLSLLSTWTQVLLASAQTRTPKSKSLWQEWLFGESVRRTIIMSYALFLSQSKSESGYCFDWLFVESLPFDRRPGLWMAESPQAWIAAARTRTGEEVGEVLSSLHEFAENHDGSDGHFCGDMFFNLVTHGHNGKISRHQTCGD